MHEICPVLVCVTGQKTCDRLIQKGVQIAAELNAPLLVGHVAPVGAPLLGHATQSEALNYLYRLACDAGAEMAVLGAPDPVERLIQYAVEQNAAHIIIGSGRPDNADRRDVSGILQARLPRVETHVVYI